MFENRTYPNLLVLNFLRQFTTQVDHEVRERVVNYQSRQMKPAEENYSVHDKELLAMLYALIKFRVHLIGERTFALYTDLASLRTAMKIRTCRNGWRDGFLLYKVQLRTERVNRVLEDVLRVYAASFTSWSAFLPLAEFALSNAVHALTGLTSFFVNSARHPRIAGTA